MNSPPKKRTPGFFSNAPRQGRRQFIWRAISLLPEILPKDDAQSAVLAAKAHNRRGDALLLLDRAQEAIAEFDQAQTLAPNNAYILYNRGRANLALGKTTEAKADFTTAASDRFDQPKAKKLALEALAQIPRIVGRALRLPSFHPAGDAPALQSEALPAAKIQITAPRDARFLAASGAQFILTPHAC